MNQEPQQQNKRMRPGAKALIVHEGKILVIHERILQGGKTVVVNDFPGGGIEFGENIIEALKREVKEEVGLTITADAVVGAWDFVIEGEGHTDELKWGVHIVCIGYQCSVVGEPVIDLTNNPAVEHIFEANWYTPEELLDPSHNFFPRAPEMLTAVRSLSL